MDKNQYDKVDTVSTDLFQPAVIKNLIVTEKKYIRQTLKMIYKSTNYIIIYSIHNIINFIL